MQYYNVHSHTFTMRNAPEKFLHLYLPPALASFINKITNTTVGAKTLQWILSKGGNAGRRYSDFLRVGKSKNQDEVFADLLAQYDDKSMQFVGLTMNMENCGAGPSQSGYEGQLEEIFLVKKRNPGRLIVFLGVDPRWKRSGKELQRAVEEYFTTPIPINATKSTYPFAGIKIYPSMGFYPFDKRLMETFEWAAEKGVPVLSHCSYLGGVFNNNTSFIKSILNSPNPYTGKPYEGAEYIQNRNLGNWLLGRQKADNNRNTCSYFMEPASFKDVFSYFKNKTKPLKLCLAHFGGDNQILDSTTEKIPFGVAKQNWHRQVKELFSEYAGLYTDISYTLHNEKVHDALFTELNHPVYGNRIMFGTDYFLSLREKEERSIYSVFKKKAMEKGLWDKVAGTNVANFLRSDFFMPNMPARPVTPLIFKNKV